jgi:asparagine synthase (glutamine-hydrolysing)
MDIKTYVPSALDDVDRMTMANSIEDRVPFLDHRVVEFGLGPPLHMQNNGTRNKYLPRLPAEQYLPREAIFRQ